MKQATLLFLIDNNQILLAMKKRGFGAGKWNGVGGKVEKNETIEDAAIRECIEEIRVKPVDLIETATLSFYNPVDKLSDNQYVKVYICKNWHGEPSESEEMAPSWFNIDDVPYAKMWNHDKVWLPEIISGKYVNADFYFDSNQDLIKHSISLS